jgi:UDP-glucose 4-epimerase
MTALVTGCAGFIGSHLTESLLKDGESIVGLDCFNDNYGRAQKVNNLNDLAKWDEFTFFPVDLAEGDLDTLVDECDAVFHLAAEPGVRASWDRRFDKYVRNNILGSQRLLDAMRRSPQTPLVYVSSSSVYGQAETFPTPELTPLRPTSPYGVTKVTGEHLCALYSESFGLPIVILRYFSVYGPRQRPDMAFHRFCRAALHGETIEIFGDGTQTRDFTFVADVVAATKAAATQAQAVGGIFNVGAGSRTSLEDTLRIINDLADRVLDVRYLSVAHGDVRDTGADSTRAREVLGFAPATRLEDGLAAEFDWLRATGGA